MILETKKADSRIAEADAAGDDLTTLLDYVGRPSLKERLAPERRSARVSRAPIMRAWSRQPSSVDAMLPYGNQGRRILVGQRLIQGLPDIFLGWGDTAKATVRPIDFYVRQHADLES